ncbi:MAG: hypothetical protein WBD87_05250 [Candidatus Acidiferrales bacterium]
MSSPALEAAPHLGTPWELPARGIGVFYGCPQIQRLSHYFLPRAIAEGKRVLYLDGANSFDPLLLARLARQRGRMPSEFNRQIRIARAFTCFQLTELLVRVRCLLQSFSADVVLLTAMPELYFDEEVRETDAISSFNRGLRALQQLAGQLPVAVFCDPSSFTTPRRKLFERVKSCAGQVCKFAVRRDNTLTISNERVALQVLLAEEG